MVQSVPQESLPGEINTATRALHAQLNKLIVARLPFALPPLANDASLYTTGLLHFAHIFLTFESLWNDQLLAASPDATASPPTSPLLSFLLVNPYSEPELFSTPPSPKVLEFLRTLRPKGLIRSTRLKRDLEYLSGLHPTDFEVLLAQYPGDKVAEFCAHIRKRVTNKPHVLVAYAWCYYMAVFSGGRWIRGELVKAGNEFWSTCANNSKDGAFQLPLEQKGLSLWSFPGDKDGVDIKEAFKERLLAAEEIFSSDERVDIIEEAKTIFKFSAELVHELDDKLGTDFEQLKRASASEQPAHQADLKGDKTGLVTPQMSHVVNAWLRRPEVTGVAVAVGCLACAFALRMSL